MLHPRDRYRKESDNVCLHISITLLFIVIVIFLGVWLILALTHVSSKSNDTKQITPVPKKITLTDISSNNTLPKKQISLKIEKLNKVIFSSDCFRKER